MHGFKVTLLNPEEVSGIAIEVVKGFTHFGRTIDLTNDDFPCPIFPTTSRALLFFVSVFNCMA